MVNSSSIFKTGKPKSQMKDKQSQKMGRNRLQDAINQQQISHNSNDLNMVLESEEVQMNQEHRYHASNLGQNLKEEPTMPDQEVLIMDEGHADKKIHFTDMAAVGSPIH